MRIRNLRIQNLYSYRDAEFSFGDYNVIVGTNASGKTNLIRILRFLSGYERIIGLQNLRLPNELKFAQQSGSTIQMDLELSDDEVTLLLGFIFKRDFTREEVKSCYGDYRYPTLAIYWKATPNPSGVDPDTLVLWFNSGTLLYSVNHSLPQLSFIDHLPKGPDETRDLFKKRASSAIPEEAKYLSLLHEIKPDAKHLKQELSSRDIDKIEVRDLQRTFDFEYCVSIFRKCSRKSQAEFGSMPFWLLMAAILKGSFDLISEHRPTFEQLALKLFDLKNKKGSREDYQRLKRKFTRVFPSIDFEVYESETQERDKPEREKYIHILDNERGFRLEDSASGYFEVLYIFSQIVGSTNSILIFDEPALHLHPTKINLLSREIIDIEGNQIILITHSPHFIDSKLLQIPSSSRLIYVKMDKESKVIAPVNLTGINMKRHEFRPEVFFSNGVCLVEGPSDRAAVMAASECLDSLFDKHDITVIDIGSKENFEKWFKLLNAYNITFVALADFDAEYDETDYILKLDGDLEDLLERLGWKRNGRQKISSNEAYDFITQICNDGMRRNELYKSKLGVLIFKAAEMAGVSKLEIERRRKVLD